MQTEIEAKFLNVSHDELRERLVALGATCVHERRLMKRQNYDFADKRLEKVGGWVRLRDEGDKITLSYKQLNDRTLHGTKEVSLVVDDFQAAGDFLQAVGILRKSKEETKRESWLLDGVQVELDEWPWIDPFVELEGPSETAVRNVAAKLGLAWQDAKFGSVEVAYLDEYDITEQQCVDWPDYHFGSVPAWLIAKRKNT